MPSTQGELDGSMPEPSEKGRDKESRHDSSGFWHRKSRPVPTLACSKEEHLSELWPLNRGSELARGGDQSLGDRPGQTSCTPL
eukprot:4748761-Pleurochrysis_carterae.AAC.1